MFLLKGNIYKGPIQVITKINKNKVDKKNTCENGKIHQSKGYRRCTPVPLKIRGWAPHARGTTRTPKCTETPVQ